MFSVPTQQTFLPCVPAKASSWVEKAVSSPFHKVTMVFLLSAWTKALTCLASLPFVFPSHQLAPKQSVFHTCRLPPQALPGRSWAQESPGTHMKALPVENPHGTESCPHPQPWPRVPEHRATETWPQCFSGKNSPEPHRRGASRVLPGRVHQGRKEPWPGTLSVLFCSTCAWWRTFHCG